MAILRTDPNVSIQQTTDGKVISPTTNDPVPVVRIIRQTPDTPVTSIQDKKVLTCTEGNPNVCTPG